MGLPKARRYRFWVFLRYSSEPFPAASETRWCRFCCCHRPSSRGIPPTPVFLEGYSSGGRSSSTGIPQKSVFLRGYSSGGSLKAGPGDVNLLSKMVFHRVFFICVIVQFLLWYSTGYATYIYIYMRFRDNRVNVGIPQGVFPGGASPYIVW